MTDTPDTPVTEIPHGTLGGYTNHGCRCPKCTTALREYTRKRVAERRQETPPERVHGTIGGYTNWRCRCPLCLQAQRDHYEARKDVA